MRIIPRKQVAALGIRGGARACPKEGLLTLVPLVCPGSLNPKATGPGRHQVCVI